MIFGCNVVLRHPHKIRIGNDVVIDDNCLIDAKGDTNRGIDIGSGVFIGRNSILSCKNGDIDVEAGANIGFNCELFSASHVRLGRDTLLAAYCYVIGGDHDFSDASKSVLEQTRTSAGVRIGGGMARRRREDPRRCHDWRQGDRRRRGSCARRCRKARLRSACRRKSSGSERCGGSS